MAEEMVNEPMNSGDITQDDKLWGALCWTPLVGGIISILVLLMEEKNSRPFVKYNAVSALIFWLALAVVGTVTLGCLGILGMIYAIYLAIQVYQGEWVEIPILTDFGKGQGWL